MPAGKEPQFTKLAELALTRREALMSTAAFIIGTATFLPSQGLAAGRHDFTAVAANTLDTVIVPKGFSWHVVASWGDPLWSDGEAFDHESRGTGASQERAIGDNNDGMELFRSGNRNILAVNNEFVNLGILYGNRSLARPVGADDIRKGKAAHGVS
ncbi:MAG: alkaline phosphatase PhoX, partial [Pseudomonadota bacterium]|nr:alkaline phosphatase PhoX [Pseudomonadota bacterium]